MTAHAAPLAAAPLAQVQTFAAAVAPSRPGRGVQGGGVVVCDRDDRSLSGRQAGTGRQAACM